MTRRTRKREEVDKVSLCDEAVQVPSSVLLAVGEPMGRVILSSFSLVFHCTPLHCTTLHCTALHCTALHCTVLYGTKLHCTALHCTALKLTYSPVKPAFSQPAFPYSPIIQLRKAITHISPLQGCKKNSFDHGTSR